jgi:hypothetical protein
VERDLPQCHRRFHMVSLRACPARLAFNDFSGAHAHSAWI